jgi:mannose-6-phosphate isomerase-like protein (cupin superfamily)
METARAIEEQGIQVNAPYSRSIKVLFAPDRRNVDELTFSVVLIDPGNGTDYHVHDRPELIYIVSGHGEGLVEGATTLLEMDTALFVRAGEWHQMKNTGLEPLKMATVFVPGIRAEDNYRRCLTAADAPVGTGIE